MRQLLEWLHAFSRCSPVWTSSAEPTVETARRRRPTSHWSVQGFPSASLEIIESRSEKKPGARIVLIDLLDQQPNQCVSDGVGVDVVDGKKHVLFKFMNGLVVYQYFVL
jgi:hypothetical protein